MYPNEIDTWCDSCLQVLQDVYDLICILTTPTLGPCDVIKYS